MGTWCLVILKTLHLACRFNQPDCTDCDRIGDYIKDEGASKRSCTQFHLPCSFTGHVCACVAGLVAECRGCCTQATHNIAIKFRSAVLEVCSHRLRYLDCYKHTQSGCQTANFAVIWCAMSLKLCITTCREFPHVETFVKEHISSYPNMRVKYYFGAPPRLNLKAGSRSETIRIDNWKTEHIVEYLKDKLLSPQFT